MQGAQQRSRIRPCLIVAISVGLVPAARIRHPEQPITASECNRNPSQPTLVNVLHCPSGIGPRSTYPANTSFYRVGRHPAPGDFVAEGLLQNADVSCLLAPAKRQGEFEGGEFAAACSVKMQRMESRKTPHHILIHRRTSPCCAHTLVARKDRRGLYLLPCKDPARRSASRHASPFHQSFRGSVTYKS